MKRIPIKTAQRIAEEYGYHQVVIIARRVGVGDDGGEHVTTYGVNRTHCAIAARIGNYIKHRIMGWPEITNGGAVASTSPVSRPGSAAPRPAR